MRFAAVISPANLRVSVKRCDWVILEEPQSHAIRETAGEGSSPMLQSERFQRDLDDIGRYNALVGRDDSTIGTGLVYSNALSEYANSCRKWLGFAEKASSRGRGCNRQAPVAVLPGTPDALIGSGVPNLPICHTVRHIARETSVSGKSHRHGIAPELLASVPELLERPVAVFGVSPGRLAVSLDALDGYGKPLVAYLDVAVPLEVGGGGFHKGDLVNFMLSVYGRQSLLNEIRSSELAGECRVLDKGALLDLASRSRLERKAA